MAAGTTGMTTRSSRRGPILALTILIAVLVIATTSAQSPRTQRIVSLVPSLTETLFAIGAGSSVVGVDHRIVLPASALFGASFLVACDLIARTFIAPVEIPVGVVTAMIGGPFFLWLLVRQG